jgi:hypothetical protein
MSDVDLGATILAVGKLHMGSRTPPLRLKVERWGGPTWSSSSLIRRAHLDRRRGAPPISDPPPPPPPPKDRKARGVRKSPCAVDLGAQIWTARSCLLLTTSASSPETLDKWVLTHSLISKSLSQKYR